MELAVEHTPEGWVLKRPNGNLVAIDGASIWPTKADLASALKPKGLLITRENGVRKPRPAGRPRTFTPEQYEERRRAANRRYYEATKAKNPEVLTERGRKYREADPAKQVEYRERSYKTRKDRMKNDPEYREAFNAYQREWRKRRKEASDGSSA